MSWFCYGAVADNVVMTLFSSVRRGSGMLDDDMLTINVGSFVHSMEFCRITSPVAKRWPTTAVRYRRIVTHDVVIMTGHSNGRIRAWDAKTGEKCHVVVVVFGVLLIHVLHHLCHTAIQLCYLMQAVQHELLIFCVSALVSTVRFCTLSWCIVVRIEWRVYSVKCKVWHVLRVLVLAIELACDCTSKSRMHGQCEVRPVVTYIAAGHRCPLAKATLSCLETDMHMYQQLVRSHQTTVNVRIIKDVMILLFLLSRMAFSLFVIFYHLHVTCLSWNFASNVLFPVSNIWDCLACSVITVMTFKLSDEVKSDNI